MNGLPQRPTQEESAQEFDRLEVLRQLLDENLSQAETSLAQYRDRESGGWYHLLPSVQYRAPGDFSRASTATCLAFARATGIGRPTPADAQRLFDRIVEGKWDSAGLSEDNPFTVSFLLEALDDLVNLGASWEPDQLHRIDDKIQLLRAAFDPNEQRPEDDGGIAVDPYPATAFLTYKAVRALKVWSLRRQQAIENGLVARVRRWSQACLHSESVLVSSGNDGADAFELMYAALTLSATTPLRELTPPQREVLTFAIDQFFGAQMVTGAWPRSRPLFHYPSVGDAYCYEYELLVALLDDEQLRPIVNRYLPALRRATDALERRRFPLDPGYAWASGHLRQFNGAESWSTASVFHFCYSLQRLVADGTRAAVFGYVGERVGEVASLGGRMIDRSKFLDSEFTTSDGHTYSLTEVLEDRFLAPLVRNSSMVVHGRGLPRGVPTSAILFGPPGTSKTQLAGIVAAALGWPLLKIDPSHLTRGGLDRLHAEAYRLFGMLQAIERVVVLLDEFDELVREREMPSEVLSRFLTTAMLPKLAALSERRRIVVLLATNHLENFDIAIRRPGRFDMIVPVNTPTFTAKLNRWPGVGERLTSFDVNLDRTKFGPLASQLSDLTYGEFDNIAADLAASETLEEFEKRLKSAHEACTLMQKDSGKTWKDRVETEYPKIRLPHPFIDDQAIAQPG